MSPEIEKLLVIQDRDRRLIQLEQQLVRIPAERVEIEERAKAATSRLEDLKAKSKLTEAERKQLENDVGSKRTQIDKWRSQQVQTKKNEEYQALAHEVENAEKEIFKIEDKELDLMERSEKLSTEIKAERKVLDEVNAQAQRQKETIVKREAAMKEEIEKLKAERVTLAASVDESYLGRYERIMRHRQDVAIVPLQHGNCGGCHLQMPPQVVHQAKRNEELVTCEQCGRILYWTGEYEAASPTALR
ncbi:MAG: C4-type zinc ribbon domain-containing protein [Verrucomicrobia bacterium]|nr:C4-type zinc ribbon domain-containing protein [Verrucomicrobiota bacterium]